MSNGFKAFLVIMAVLTVAVLLFLPYAEVTPQAAPASSSTAEPSNLDQFIHNNANDAMKKITHKVAEDQIQQFKIALRNGGTVMDLCVQAGMVTASLLQDQDEAGYAEWKKIQKKTCQAAGIDQ